jgi:hypothetical protein
MEDDFEFPTPADLISWISSLSAEEQRRVMEFANLISSELMAAGSGGEEKELLFAGNVGSKIIKCLHFPFEVLGEDGPLVLPSSNPKVILGAVSDELVYRKVAEYTDRYNDDFTRSQQWELYLHGVAAEIVEMSENTEVDWDVLLD